MLDSTAIPGRAATTRRDDHPADALFVLSGAPERKEFAVEVMRGGRARDLVVSVGRFEWRRYGLLGLPGEAELRAAVATVPAAIRHFFLVVPGMGPGGAAGGVRVIGVPPERFGTRRELRALRPLAEERGWRSLVLLTSAFHLRRTSLMAERIFRGSGISLAYAAVPPDRDRFAPGRWWRTSHGVRAVIGEYGKLALYAALLRR